MPVWLLKVFSSRLTWYALAAVAVFGIIAVQTHRVHAAQAKVESLQTELQVQIDQVKAATNANQTNQTTIKTLQEQNDSIVAARKLDEAKAAALISQREDEAAIAKAAATKARKDRDAIWKSTQSCTGLAAIRIDTACPDVASRLRDRTASHN